MDLRWKIIKLKYWNDKQFLDKLTTSNFAQLIIKYLFKTIYFSSCPHIQEHTVTSDFQPFVDGGLLSAST